MVELHGRRVFADVFGPPPRLLVYGAVDTADALCAAARGLGWHTIVADARGRFATRERLPNAHEVIVAWPDETLAQVQPDHATAVVVLTHDDKFDIPMLVGTLTTDAYYIGALGSRRNQERRRERLLEAGVDESALDRISGPAGLDIGAHTRPRPRSRCSRRSWPCGPAATADGSETRPAAFTPKSAERSRAGSRRPRRSASASPQAAHRRRP